MQRRSAISGLLLAIILVCTLTSAAQTQVTVIRGGNENPMISIAKSTIYGAATGLLLGLALTLVVDEDTGDILKWGFVGGTFGGFIVGLYHIAHRPQPASALLNLDIKGARLKFPEPRIRITRSNSVDFRIGLVSIAL